VLAKCANFENFMLSKN